MTASQVNLYEIMPSLCHQDLKRHEAIFLAGLLAGETMIMSSQHASNASGKPCASPAQKDDRASEYCQLSAGAAQDHLATQLEL